MGLVEIFGDDAGAGMAGRPSAIRTGVVPAD